MVIFLSIYAKIIIFDFNLLIYIIMDYITKETQNCYIEFYSKTDA